MKNYWTSLVLFCSCICFFCSCSSRQLEMNVHADIPIVQTAYDMLQQATLDAGPPSEAYVGREMHDLATFPFEDENWQALQTIIKELNLAEKKKYWQYHLQESAKEGVDYYLFEQNNRSIRSYAFAMQGEEKLINLDAHIEKAAILQNNHQFVHFDGIKKELVLHSLIVDKWSRDTSFQLINKFVYE